MTTTMSRGARVRRAPDPARKGKASDSIEKIDRLRPGDRVFLVARVSTPAQFSEGNHESQLWAMRRKVERARAEVVGDYSYHAKGWEPDHYAEAFSRARAAGATVVLYATRNRLVRQSVDFWAVAPTAAQLRAIIGAAGRLRVMVLYRWTATDAKQERFLSRLGQRYRRSGKGGRRAANKETLDRLWDELKEWVQDFRRDTSWSVNRIAGMAMRWAERRGFTVARRTVYNWCREADEACAFSSAGTSTGA